MLAYRVRVPHGKGVAVDGIETTQDATLALSFLTQFHERHANDIGDGEDDLQAPSLSIYEASDGATFTLNSEADVTGIIEANY